MTIIDRDGATRPATLAAEPGQPEYMLRRAYPPFPSEWRHLPDTLSSPLPLYLKNVGVSYWFEYLPDARTVYFQFNCVANDPSESLAEFAARLFA